MEPQRGARSSDYGRYSTPAGSYTEQVPWGDQPSCCPGYAESPSGRTAQWSREWTPECFPIGPQSSAVSGMRTGHLEDWSDYFWSGPSSG